MIIYHAICVAWNFDLQGVWDITDFSLLPEGVKAIINREGKLEHLNPCVFFPYLHFFMPWFFYKSGQFFEKQNVKDLWKKDWNKLIKNFVIWSLVGYVFYLLFGLLNHSITLRSATYSIIRGLFLEGNIPVNEPLWFLLTLFIVRLIANLVLPTLKEQYCWLRIAVIILVGYVISYLAYYFNFRLLPDWVANSAAGLSFFALGYALKEYEKRLYLIIPCLVIYVTCCCYGFSMVDMIFNKLLSGYYMLWLPTAFCSIIVFNSLCKIIYKYFGNIRLIESIGQHAMPIYVTHYLFGAIVCFVVTYFKLKISSQHLIFLILACYIIFLPLICKYRSVLKKYFDI